ncbi:sialin-like [Penaeus japonicus]|uniref:sialin-like n=1 Tax=Penaeus japonicus TaxID=27405 RepID=UPI001C7176D9|nr:sialin-like [Penaeus japonicus]XP_042885007.1 sialin-like [Penaeus japonicus]
MSSFSPATTVVIAGAALSATNSGRKSECGSMQVRYILVLLGMLGVAVDYLVRYSISVAIVAMVKTPHWPTNTSHDKLVCPAAINGTDDGGVNPHAEGEYDWSEQTTGIILGMFFWGYFITKAAGGRIAELVGARRTMAASLGASGLLSLLCPSAANLHPMALAGLRLAMGLVQGPAFPALYSLLSRWALPGELATMVSVSFSGMLLGNMVALGGSGLVVEWFGWRWVFWISGILALVWTPLWLFLVCESPEEHPWITLDEKRLLAVNLDVKPRRRVPWSHVLRCWTFFAAIVAEFSGSWVSALLTTEAPTFLTNQIGLSLQSSGYVCLVGTAISYVFAIFYGKLSDFLIQKEYLTKVNVRRLLYVIGFVVVCSSMMGIVLAKCDTTIVSAFVVVAMAGGSTNVVTFQLAPMDLAPNYAGTLSGLIGIGNIGSFAAPLVTSKLLVDLENGWSATFLLGGGIYFLLGIFYVFVVRADIEPWNYYDEIAG